MLQLSVRRGLPSFTQLTIIGVIAQAHSVVVRGQGRLSQGLVEVGVRLAAMFEGARGILSCPALPFTFSLALPRGVLASVRTPLRQQHANEGAEET